MFLRSAMLAATSGSVRSTKQIVCKYSTAGFSSDAITSAAGAVSTLSGSMTSGVYKTLFNLTGVGSRVSHLTFRANDAVSRTISVRVTVDGVDVFNFTSAAITTTGNGLILSGINSASRLILPDIVSVSQLLIEYASSITESDKITAEYAYVRE